SLDTPICAKIMERFNEIATHDPNILVLCVSADLPFAQNRFCSSKHLDNIEPVSVFRHTSFGKDYGVLITDGPLRGLLARAIIALDEKANIGAVLCLEHIVHPISVARLVMQETPHVMLSGDGALDFALTKGFRKTNLLTPASEKEWKEWLQSGQYKPKVNIENHDTIGMIALDANGDLSGACTTSGMAYKMHGRIGDSPIIGAGLYVDNEVGAATATGHGEEVVRVVGSFLVVELMRQGFSPQKACEEAVKRIKKKFDLRKANLSDTQIGFIALNKKGQHGAFCLQKGFNFAVQDQKISQLIDAKSLL
ncbi:MAG TPA: isoaspartyl peptidase/L-asparaginase, partial [Saprospiraceae bacterium]|nr:isoaspartyl peptidase/L-asparaginase [Saprospiraceae bacterium]